MVGNEELSSNRPAAAGSDAKLASEQAYREKIVARQCLNMLVDIRTALSRQNKMLELLIDHHNAAHIRNTAK